MAEALTKGSRITGDQRGSLATAFAERYAGGESIRSIAEDTGRSYGFVHGILKEAGATLRGRGGATRGPSRKAMPTLGAADEPAPGAEPETSDKPEKGGKKGKKPEATKDAKKPGKKSGKKASKKS
jgi:helix-turn-helix protein